MQKLPQSTNKKDKQLSEILLTRIQTKSARISNKCKTQLKWTFVLSIEELKVKWSKQAYRQYKRQPEGTEQSADYTDYGYINAAGRADTK